MNLSSWVRQIHRWTAMVFTVAAVIIFALVAGGKEPPEWVYLTPLLPLALLAITGLYLFVLPYVARRHDRQAGD